MEFHVDVSTVKTREDLHKMLTVGLPLPSYYGNNLDALYDILTEPHEQWDVTFTGCANAKQALGAYFENLRETFSDATEEGCSVTAVWND